MNTSPGAGGPKTLFTGANPRSRTFETLVAAAAVFLGAAAVTRLPDSAWPAHGAAVSVLTALTACAATIVGGLGVLAAGQKTFMNFGGGAALAAVLALPARFALPAAFAGTLATQVVRRLRGDRLSIPTIVFNQAQRVAGWAIAEMLYARLRTDPRIPSGDGWLPIAAAAVGFWLVNSWIMATWNALRRDGSAWDLWSRKVREMAPVYGIESSAVVLAARASAAYPIPAMAMLGAAGIVYVTILRGVGVVHNRHTPAFHAGPPRPPGRPRVVVDRRERAVLAAMGIPIDIDDVTDAPPAESSAAGEPD